MWCLAFVLIAMCLIHERSHGEEKEKEKARVKPVKASDFEDIVNNFGYLLEGVHRVVWILDQSPSMADDIAKVRQRIDKWLDGIDPVTQVGLIVFSQKPQVLLPLTKDRAAIKAAFEKYTTQDSSQENVYAAIAEALAMLPGKESSAILVATDETGDDDKHLTGALRECAARKLFFYAVTPHASFGNKVWQWVEPDFKAKISKAYQSCNGPESFGLEALFNFHFVQRSNWDSLGSPQDTRFWAMDAGWAPFGLHALAEATQGRVYELKTDTCRFATLFDERKRSRYTPDLDTPNILRHIQRTPWRLAVQNVTEHWARNFKDIERIFRGSGKQALLAGCARQIPAIQANICVADAVLEQLAAALKNKQGVRSSDESPDSIPHLRWRANLELAYASASVARFHLQQILADFERFKDPNYELPGAKGEVYGYKLNCIPSARNGVDTLSGTPDAQGFYDMLDSSRHTLARTLDQMRTQAECALSVVQANHKDTPWASMAAQLKQMLGSYEPEVLWVAKKGAGWSSGKGNK